LTAATLPASDAPHVPPTLRAAHKELTRGRIRDAARILFFRNGYSVTTMDQIAMAAGIRRSTLYFHYKDKEEIVRRIAEDYAPKAKAVAERLEGPYPTRAQVAAWLAEVIDFVQVEQAPTVLFRDLTGMAAPPAGVRHLGDELIEAWAKRLPAFRAAVVPSDEQPVQRARAELVLREVTRACLQASRENPLPQVGARLTLAGDMLYNFSSGRTNLLA
jgi:AcrR family transcriptional regulator